MFKIDLLSELGEKKLGVNEGTRWFEKQTIETLYLKYWS